MLHETLAFAQSLEPPESRDPQRARLTLEAAWATGDPGAIDRAVERVARVDTTDTPSLLRLISARLDRLQTAEERLAGLEQFLGPRGDALDRTVRSRLALDAALLRRELGDEAAFAGHLASAIRFDPTNRQATNLAAAFYAERVDDPVGLFQLQTAQLRASPLEPSAFEAMARNLAANGALAAAARVFAPADAIRRREGTTTLDGVVRAAVIQWAGNGPDGIVELMAQLHEQQRATERARELAAFRAENGPSAEPPEFNPRTVRLDPVLEELRAFAARAAEDNDAVSFAFAEFDNQIIVGDLEDPATAALADRVELLRAVFGAPARPRRDDLPPVAARTRSRVDAWNRVRAGEGDAVMAELRASVSAAEDPWLMLLLAELAADRGDAELAVESLLTVSRLRPLQPVGAWARDLLVRYTQERYSHSVVALNEDGSEMIELVNELPDWYQDLPDEPERFLGLRAQARPMADPGELDPPRIEITLRNASPARLGLGPDREIGTRVLLTARLIALDQPLGATAPTVLDLRRRLSLPSGRELSVTVAAVEGLAELALEINRDQSLRLQPRVVQSFRPGRRGLADPGPFATSVTVQPISLPPLPEAALTPERLAERLGGATGTALERAVAAAGGLLYRAAAGAEPPDAARVIAASCAELAATGSAELVTLLALNLPPASQLPAMRAFDAAAIERATTEPDPALVAAVLLTRVASAEHELIDHAGSIEQLATLARARRAQLETGGRVSPALNAQDLGITPRDAREQNPAP